MIIYGQERLEMKIFKAFTLAEILITLGIIGIVAAMTIPTLMTKIQTKKTVSQLRATQSILSQAFRMAEEENGDPSSWEFKHNNKDATVVAEKIRPYIKIAVDCKQEISDKCFSYNIYKHLAGDNDFSYATNTYYYKFILLNGVSVTFRGPYGNEIDSILIVVDLNGKLPPNVYGKDSFYFVYTNSTLLPVGAPDCSKYLNFNCSYETTCKLNGSGNGCAYYVLKYQNMNYLKK